MGIIIATTNNLLNRRWNEIIFLIKNKQIKNKTVISNLQYRVFSCVEMAYTREQQNKFHLIQFICNLFNLFTYNIETNN